MESYKGNMGSKAWKTDFEVAIFSNLYEKKIIVYTLRNELDIQKCGEIIPLDNEETNEEIILLFSGNERNGHWEVLKEHSKII